MKILIFGASGFLGKEVTELLKFNNLEIFEVTRNDNKTNFNIDISVYDNFKILPNNFFDIVINCATILPGGNYLDNDYLEKIYKTNILGSQNICKWIDSQNTITKIINCSTLVVANKPWPINFNESVMTYPTGNHVLYSSSKLMQELIFQTLADFKKINIVNIRFSALYGKSMLWNGIICNLIDQAKNNKIELFNANMVFADFLNVKDAAKIILSTIQNSISGILNACSGNEISLMNLAECIIKCLGKNIKIINNDSENFIEQRAKINIDKLKQYIDTNSFINLNDGIIEILNK